MKKLITTLLFIQCILVFGQQVVASKATFGRYSDSCLGGRGLCSFNIDGGSKVLDNTSGKITSDTFVLKIKRSTLSPSQEINIAGKAFKDFEKDEKMYFYQSDKLVLTAAALKSINISPHLNVILPGNYPISVNAENVEVIFKLTAAK